MVAMRSLLSGKCCPGAVLCILLSCVLIYCVVVLCAPGHTLVLYLFKCEHFITGRVPSDRFLVNQEHLPSPPLVFLIPSCRKTY